LICCWNAPVLGNVKGLASILIFISLYSPYYLTKSWPYCITKAIISSLLFHPIPHTMYTLIMLIVSQYMYMWITSNKFVSVPTVKSLFETSSKLLIIKLLINEWAMLGGNSKLGNLFMFCFRIVVVILIIRFCYVF
jgi:hypothetical protein